MPENLTTQQLSELFKKYKDGTLEPAEQRLLDAWYESEVLRSDSRLSPEVAAGLSERLRASLPLAYAAKQRRLWPRLAAAASILLACCTGAYFILRQRPQPEQVIAARHDVAPGHRQATLTLGNGQKIILSKALHGQLAIQGNTTIQANTNNIAYQSGRAEAQITYNTLTTARGEQSPYPLVLADGTKVWLNAESSLTFPTAFNGKERIVRLTGEAYFEVKHNAAQPFKVQTEKQTIDDIGTRFNVQAYANEPRNLTTLLEGAVKVNGKLLQPGQQSDGEKLSMADTEATLAWKNGDFIFQHQDLPAVMRQIARWYDVEVVYDPSAPSQHIPYGIISRSKNISAVLKIMEATGKVHFSVEGRRVMVKR